MRISNREKNLLCVLGIIVFGFLYYQFGYTTLNKIVNEKTKKNQDMQQRYQNAKNTLSSMEAQKAKLKIINNKISNQSSSFYPVISQDHIILEIDKLINESGLQGGMTFKDVEVQSVVPEKKSDKDKELSKSSIQDITDEYKNKYESNVEDKKDENKDKDEAKKNDAATSNNKNSNSASSTDSNGNKNSDSANDKKENTVYQMQLNVDFNGTYAQAVKFMELLRNYDKKMPAYAISMSTKNLTEVKGSVDMMIYAMPKIDDKELEDYLSWNLNNTYGKDKPFTVNSDVGTGIKSNTSNGDFLVAVNSSDSDLPTVTIGKANDALRSTYVYDDSQIETEAEVVLSKVGDKYYYKYKTNNGSIPKDYSGYGYEFVPSSENILINIQSQSRINTDDQAGLKLKIVNNTDKYVNVNVSGDDKSSPRVSIDGDSTNINVNEK